MLEEIRSDLQTMTAAVASAREGLTRNEFIDIGDVGERVKNVAEKVGGLGPDDAAEIKSHLTDLLEEFRLFSEDVRAKLTLLSEASGIPRASAENGDNGAA